MLESVRLLSQAVAALPESASGPLDLPLLAMPAGEGLYGELEAVWQRLISSQRAFGAACEVVQEALLAADKGAAMAAMNEVHQASQQLFGLLVSGSLQELAGHFSAREQMMLANIEAGFCEAAQLAQFAIDIDAARFCEADSNFLRITGLPEGMVLGAPVAGVFPDDEWARMVESIDPLSHRSTLVVRARGYDGRRILLKMVLHMSEGYAGGVLRGFAVDWSQTEADMQQRRLLAAAIDVSDRMVLITNREQEIVFANPAFTHLTGYTLDEVKGRKPDILQGPDTDPLVRQQIHSKLAAGQPVNAELLNYSKEGLRYWVDLSIVPVTDDLGEVTHYVSVAHDSTDRKAQELEIARLALFDHLTGLPNRRAGEERLQIEWKRATRQDGMFAVALVDIDFFKRINDTHGHAVGDEALKHVAGLIRASLRGGDWAARWGGEEFLVCFSVADMSHARQAAERLRQAIEQSPLGFDGGVLNMTASIGVVLYAEQVDDIDALIEVADSLLYKAKEDGRNQVKA